MRYQLVALWLSALCMLHSVAQISGKNTVLCRQLADKVQDATKPFVQDNACALDVLLVASPGGPGRDIKFYFQVNRTKIDSFEPNLQYEIPSNPLTPLAAFDQGYVGIVPGNFDSSKISSLETITFINSSQLIRRNFSAFGVETLLEQKVPVSIKQTGVVKAVGWFRLMDKSNVTHEYVAVRDNVDIKESTVHSFPNIVYDEKTTYCWRVQNQTKSDGLVYDDGTFDSNCPISMKITNPLVVTNLVPFEMSWSMSLVANYLTNGGKGVYDLGFPPSTEVPVLHSSIHLCTITEENQCHMFNPKNYSLSSENQIGGVLAGDTSAPPTSFGASNLTLMKGQYIGFAHGIVKKADGSLLHVATYFQIKVDEKGVTPTNGNAMVAQVATKSYCWLVYAPASARNVSLASTISGYSVADSCPLALSLTSTGQATTNTPVEFKATATPLSLMPNLVTVATLPESFTITLASVSYCKNSSVCGPFEPPSTNVDLESTGSFQYKPLNLIFKETGTYKVYFTATVDLGKGLRLDTSVLAGIIVQDPVPPTSNTTLYIAIIGGVVGFLALVGIGWCCVNRRRKARWDRHRLQRGAMNYKEPNSSRVNSAIPMVNQRGNITEVPRLFVDESDGQNKKLDLAVSHYMYNQDTHRVDEMTNPPRRVTSQYDQRNSLGYDVHQEDIQPGYDDYYRNKPQRTKSRGYDDYERRRATSRGQDEYNLYAGQPSHQLVIRDEYNRGHQRPAPNSQQLTIGAPQYHSSNDDEYGLDQKMSPSSVHNNYGGYNNTSFGNDTNSYLR